MKTYKVVHFVPKLERGLLGGAEGTAVERQLADIINREAGAGWEFVTFQTAHVEIQPGCLAGLLGKKVEFVDYDVILFAK